MEESRWRLTNKPRAFVSCGARVSVFIDSFFVPDTAGTRCIGFFFLCLGLHVGPLDLDRICLHESDQTLLNRKPDADRFYLVGHTNR